MARERFGQFFTLIFEGRLLGEASDFGFHFYLLRLVAKKKIAKYERLATERSVRAQYCGVSKKAVFHEKQTRQVVLGPVEFLRKAPDTSILPWWLCCGDNTFAVNLNTSELQYQMSI